MKTKLMHLPGSVVNFSKLSYKIQIYPFVLNKRLNLPSWKPLGRYRLQSGRNCTDGVQWNCKTRKFTFC